MSINTDIPYSGAFAVLEDLQKQLIGIDGEEKEMQERHRQEIASLNKRRTLITNTVDNLKVIYPTTNSTQPNEVSTTSPKEGEIIEGQETEGEGKEQGNDGGEEKIEAEDSTQEVGQEIQLEIADVNLADDQKKAEGVHEVNSKGEDGNDGQEDLEGQEGNEGREGNEGQEGNEEQGEGQEGNEGKSKDRPRGRLRDIIIGSIKALDTPSVADDVIDYITKTFPKEGLTKLEIRTALKDARRANRIIATTTFRAGVLTYINCLPKFYVDSQNPTELKPEYQEKLLQKMIELDLTWNQEKVQS